MSREELMPINDILKAVYDCLKEKFEDKSLFDAPDEFDVIIKYLSEKFGTDIHHEESDEGMRIPCKEGFVRISNIGGIHVTTEFIAAMG